MGVSLQKGQKVDLTKGNPGLSKIVIGLGWDTNKYDGGSDFDLDASAFLLNANGKVIDGHAQKNANEINSNLGQNVAEALDNGNTNINDLTHAITGKKENVNPEAKRFAEHNEAQNKTTYTNATEGKDKLIETGYFPKSDNINNSKLGKTSTEDLARIHNHDNINNSLNESSKASLCLEFLTSLSCA